MDTDPLRFDNRFIAQLPGDEETGPRVREVRGAAWSAVMPTPVADPQLLALSTEVAELLGIGTDLTDSADFARVFGGNALYAGMQPWAANYGGHQFGHWAGQLGDGRAISLGELVAADGAHWELQLKGAGRTPYSRGADGRAVLRSSIREFLCSEAMHHLGVPTTRALSLVGSGDS
uniref:protein adenylyltransferase SelO family protein n=1 Tax=Stenotrophomonas sp. TaxID=69392 RepID=UPI00289A5D24